PDRAVDGNPRTRWSSKFEDDQWIQVDLSAPVSFDQVTIVWEQAYARDFVIQVSDDGQRWTDVKSVSNAVTQLKISVNGVPVFARGGNWGWDELLRRVLPDRLADTVEMHRDMNFTMIRNWLGSSNREELYQACDEQGILVWNDFWQAGAFLPNPPGYVDIAADTIRRFRHHPSIVVWCGANEGDPPPIVDAGLKQAAATEHPEILYIPNSAGGIVSGHGPYHWVEPATYNNRNTYDTGAFGFHTEIGMPVVSVVESMRNLVGDAPEWPIGEVWNYHDWSTIGNQRVGTYQAAIDARLGESDSLDEFATRAQFVNYESHRAMFEAWNANLWQDATGLLLWMSHPAWHSTVWQTYDYDLDVNGAYYGARKGCEPVHVQADPGTWQVRVVNHTAAPLSGVTVSARRYDLSGRSLGSPQRQRVDVARSATTAVFPLAAPDGGGLHLVRLELRDSRDRLLAENTYWRYDKAEQLRALNDVPSTRLSTSSSTVRVVDGRNTVTTTVRNQGRTVAALVRLAVRDQRGERVLPVRYDDNYFWLLPGESREVRISWPARSGLARQVTVTAQAYNS
ncbi:galactose-binding domain-containing protein, partial [Micromonospora arida]